MRTRRDETTEKEARAPVEQALAEAVAGRRGEGGGARCSACIRRAWTAQNRGPQPRVNQVSFSKDLVVDVNGTQREDLIQAYLFVYKPKHLRHFSTY